MIARGRGGGAAIDVPVALSEDGADYAGQTVRSICKSHGEVREKNPGRPVIEILAKTGDRPILDCQVPLHDVTGVMK